MLRRFAGRRWAAGLLLLSASALQTPAALAQDAGNATIAAPGNAEPGDRLTIAVDGFTPGAEIQLFLMGPGPVARLLSPADGSAIADPAGSAKWTAVVPSDLSPGADSGWWLSADDLAGRFANRPLAFFAALPAPALANQARDGWANTVRASSAAPRPAATVVAVASPSPTAAPAPAVATPTTPTATATAPSSAPFTALPGTWATVLGDGPTAPTPSFTTSTALRLRAEPSVSSAILAPIRAGTRLRLLGGPTATADADFYRVQLPDGTTGYAAAAPEDIAAARAESGTAAGSPYRLRLGPSTASTARALVMPGSRVQLTGIVEGTVDETWVRVDVTLPSQVTVVGYLPAGALKPEQP